MANQEHLELLRQGVAQWNELLKRHQEIWPDFREADLSNVFLSGADLSGADLSGADLSNANLNHAFLSGANLRDANLNGANLREADLSGTDLSNTFLKEADLRDADLNHANLCDANLRNANLRNADLNNVSLSGADLGGANLINADLNHAFLRRADLTEADLSGADLSSANLNGAILGKIFSRGTIRNRGTGLIGNVFLSGVDLKGADLSNVDLRDADLIGANLYGANLNGTNLSGAKAWGTIFANVDLRETKGLAEIRHEGPSSVTLDTIQLPQDGSALHFLRGTGVPDAWIALYQAEMTHPIQYHSCFISYSSQDDTLARRLYSDLQDHGVRCWFAPEDMKTGDKIRARIDEAIHLQDKLLLLLSEHAIASAWVEDEVEAAMEKELRQQCEVLFPVRLDESVMQTTQPWAAKLRRTRHIGDFTHWMAPQAYQRAFERLLQDLKAESNTKGEADGKPGAS